MVVHIHDYIAGQCTPGFECCMHKVPDNMKPFMDQLANEALIAQGGTKALYVTENEKGEICLDNYV
jgi:hypothetical protein